MYILFPDSNPNEQQQQYNCRGEKCIHQLTVILPNDDVDEAGEDEAGEDEVAVVQNDEGTSRYYFQGEQDHNREFISYETAQEGIDTFRAVMQGLEKSKQLINLSDFIVTPPKPKTKKAELEGEGEPKSDAPPEQPTE